MRGRGRRLAQTPPSSFGYLSQPIEGETALRFARTGVRIGYRIAMGEQRPTWNEGDFFGDKFGNP